MKIRVVIVDDHPALRLGIPSFLAEQPDFDVVGETDDGVQALRLVRSSRPDIVVLEARLPRWDGIDIAPEILQAVPETRLLVYTSHYDKDLARSLLRLGVQGYLLKSSCLSDLATALRQIVRGGSYVDSTLLPFLLDASGSSDQGPTPRELEVLHLVAQGMRNRDIAMQLNITERTVHYHVSNLATKLGANGRVDLVRRAWDRSWLGKRGPGEPTSGT